MEPTKSQLIYKNACLSEGIEKLQIENEELRVQNEALGLKIKHIKEDMGTLYFYYKETLMIMKEQLAEKDKEIEICQNTIKKLIKNCNTVMCKNKIDYAVEHLRKAKYLITQEYRFDVEESDFAVAYEDDIDKIFDQLITEIKEGK